MSDDSQIWTEEKFKQEEHKCKALKPKERKERQDYLKQFKNFSICNLSICHKGIATGIGALPEIYTLIEFAQARDMQVNEVEQLIFQTGKKLPHGFECQKIAGITLIHRSEVAKNGVRYAHLKRNESLLEEAERHKLVKEGYTSASPNRKFESDEDLAASNEQVDRDGSDFLETEEWEILEEQISACYEELDVLWAHDHKRILETNPLSMLHRSWNDLVKYYRENTVSVKKPLGRIIGLHKFMNMIRYCTQYASAESKSIELKIKISPEGNLTFDTPSTALIDPLLYSQIQFKNYDLTLLKWWAQLIANKKMLHELSGDSSCRLCRSSRCHFCREPIHPRKRKYFCPAKPRGCEEKLRYLRRKGDGELATKYLKQLFEERELEK